MPQDNALIPLFDALSATQNPSREDLFSGNRFIKAAVPAERLNDYRYSAEFLYSYRGQPDTYASYRREVERLLQWSWYIEQKSLPELRRVDIEAYLAFCQSPPEDWIGYKTVARYRQQHGERQPNPDWRPFVIKVSKAEFKQGIDPQQRDFQLSQKALQAIFSILSSFFNFLIQEEYCEYNPVALIRQKSRYLRKQQGKGVIRRLSELQWSYVIETAALMAQQSPAEHERTLFIMQCLYGMYLRISELAASERWTPQMGDFKVDMDNNWWFSTVGKGNKLRDISVSDAMLNALKRYRESRNLSPLPSPGEQTVLLTKNRGKGPINSTRQIRNIVQNCFDHAIKRMQEEGFQEDAERLLSATVHWLRHTGISDDVKHRPREHVRDDAGHGSSAITDKYIDIELRERHASAKQKKINPLG